MSDGSASDEELPEHPPERSRMASLFGLLLAPLLYVLRRVLSPAQHGRDSARDELELQLLKLTAVRDLPVLGICRGAQLMNLSQGGTLLRHVSAFYEERPQLYTTMPRRDVLIRQGSALARALQVRKTRVNSLHYHAVDQPGTQVEIVAREPSGVVQAIEHAERGFWIGVQWHPEYLPQLPVQQRLFGALVQQAKCGSQKPDTHRTVEARYGV